MDEGEARQDGAERTSGGLAFDKGRGSSSTAVTSRHHKPCRGLTALHQPVTGQSTGIRNPSLCDVLSTPSMYFIQIPKISLEHGCGSIPNISLGLSS